MYYSISLLRITHRVDLGAQRFTGNQVSFYGAAWFYEVCAHQVSDVQKRTKRQGHRGFRGALTFRLVVLL